MKCSECGYNNRTGTRYCRSCGTLLPKPPAAASKRPPKKETKNKNNTIVSARHGVVRLRKDVEDFKRAGFGIRFLAMVIDLFFVGMLDGALLFGGGMLIGKTTGIIDMILTSRGLEFLQVIAPLLKAAIVTMVCIPPLYFVIMIAVFGQTIGKMITGIRVVGSNGGRISYARACVRLIGYVPSALLLFAGFLWIIWDPERQGWHDMLADTFLISL